MRDLMNKLLTTGEDVMLLCKDEKQLSVFRTQISRERVKMLKSPETHTSARLISSQTTVVGNRLFLRLFLKDKPLIYKFSDSGELQEVKE